MQKFADISIKGIMEENLCLSNDYTEVIFKVLENRDGERILIFLSIDI